MGTRRADEAGRHQAGEPSRRSAGRSASLPPALDLQRRAGNGAVAALVQREPLVEGVRGLLAAGPARAPGAVQRDLKGDLRPLLEVYGPPHYDGIIRLIRAAPVPERQVAAADPTTLDLIRQRFSGVWATAIVSSLLEGSQNWANPPATAFYRHFVLDQKQGPVPGGATMNCWESIMYAAHLAGVLSASWIRNYYISAGAVPNTTVDPTPALWAQLGYSTSLPTYNPSAGRVPSEGQLVFYTVSGSSIPAHVAVSMGGGEVMSLWTQPRGVHQVQRCAITDIAGTIRYGNTPW